MPPFAYCLADNIEINKGRRRKQFSFELHILSGLHTLWNFRLKVLLDGNLAIIGNSSFECFKTFGLTFWFTFLSETRNAFSRFCWAEEASSITFINNHFSEWFKSKLSIQNLLKGRKCDCNSLVFALALWSGTLVKFSDLTLWFNFLMFAWMFG